MSDVLQVSHVVKKFGQTTVLKDISFTIEAGEVFGFLGPNGAGKSTTIRTILGLLQPTSGQIKLLGQDITTHVVQTHQQLAYVPGDVFLWPNLTGGEIIDLLLRMGGHPRTKRVDELIEKFELDPRKKARTYSKGNRQKVAIIAALSADVPFYIFDEPTSGLDPLQERHFQEEIAALKAAGKTVLLSSHILSEVEKLVDRVAIIRAGEIIEIGTLADMQHHAALHVKATVTTPALFETYDQYQVLNNEVQFMVDRHEIATVMQQLQQAGVTDVQITPPTLEDIFMQYYNAEEGGQDA